MSREINFRCFDKIEKKFLHDNEYWINQNGNVFLDNGYHEPYDICLIKETPDRFCLMQYAGIKDKNGKEIYEGDILECKFKQTYSEELHHTGIYHVVFDKASFKVKRIKLTSNSPYSHPSLLRIGDNRQKRNEFMIIGNIFENPDLLDKK